MPYHQQAGQMHQCGEDPADGVADVKHRGGVEQPEDGGDPDEAEQAAAHEADHHRPKTESVRRMAISQPLGNRMYVSGIAEAELP